MDIKQLNDGQLAAAHRAAITAVINAEREQEECLREGADEAREWLERIEMELDRRNEAAVELAYESATNL